jgi:polysaccharide pyruvyl transferase CsaB
MSTERRRTDDGEQSTGNAVALVPIAIGPTDSRIEGMAIGISGSYGGLNVGDEAILTATVEQLRQAVPGVRLTVFTRNVAHTRANHDVDRVIDARRALLDELTGAIEGLDLLLLGGGGLLYDGEAETYLHLPRLAQRLGVRTATYAIGAGPLERTADRHAIAQVLNEMACITVRDTGAQRLLEESGVDREIVVTADPALLLDPDPGPGRTLEDEGVDTSRRIIGMSVREPGGAAADLEDGGYHRLLAHAADFVAARFDADVLFVPMERQDVRQAYRVIAEMGLPDRAMVLRGNYSPCELLRLIGELDLAVGMRLHFVIFAAIGGVPVLGLPYASKVASFLECLDLPSDPMIGPQHTGTLLASIDRLWDTRAERRRLQQERLPLLRDEAARTTGLIAELLDPEVRPAAAAPV